MDFPPFLVDILIDSKDEKDGQHKMKTPDVALVRSCKKSTDITPANSKVRFMQISNGSYKGVVGVLQVVVMSVIPEQARHSEQF